MRLGGVYYLSHEITRNQLIPCRNRPFLSTYPMTFGRGQVLPIQFQLSHVHVRAQPREPLDTRPGGVGRAAHLPDWLQEAAEGAHGPGLGCLVPARGVHSHIQPRDRRRVRIQAHRDAGIPDPSHREHTLVLSVQQFDLNNNNNCI